MLVTFRVAGVDFSTKAAELVLVSIDGYEPVWHHIDYPAGDAFDRAKAIPTVMPTAGWWEDMGVIHIAIEEPRASRTRNGIEAVFRAQGCLLASLPQSIETWQLAPHEWRQALGMPGSGKRDIVKAAARAYALEHGAPGDWTEDAYDAWCVATAALRMLDRAADTTTRKDAA